MTAEAVAIMSVGVLAGLLATTFFLPQKFENIKPLFLFASLFTTVLMSGMALELSTENVGTVNLDKLAPILTNMWVMLSVILVFTMGYWFVVAFELIRDKTEDLADEFRRQ